MNKTFATLSLTSILAHNPCEEGLHNFKKTFGHLDPDTPVPLLACLESNSVQDVIWALRAVHQDISAVIPLIAADFAESVLHIFEEKFPGDDRPRKAIEAVRSGDREKARAAARAAVRAAARAASTDAAAAAAAYYAAAAAAAAAAADAARASYAAQAAAATATAADAECNKQAEILRKYFSSTQE